MVVLALALSFFAETRSEGKTDGSSAAVTPIRHVIVIVGENRTFDHIFGLYRPRHGQSVWNLLSRRILNADGTPGLNYALAEQFQAAAQSLYYIDPQSKTPYATLPPPSAAQVPNAPSNTRPPFAWIAAASAVEPDLAPADRKLLTTGASGLAKTASVDTRVANYAALPAGPFQLTGPTLPYDSYTGDTVHRFFQMWQQSDCDGSGAKPGCRGDLYPFVAVTCCPGRLSGSNSMAVYNVNDGDAPYLKRLADNFTISDNFHQSFMGGTGANHVMLASGDDVFFSDSRGPASPPAAYIANPNPQPGTLNRYIRDANWVDCSDPAQPGVAPIAGYLRRLGLSSNCAAGHFYMINNTPPGFLPNGAPRVGRPGTFVPPSTLRTIGDALTERGVSWAYYGGAFDAAVKRAGGDRSAATAVGQAYCQICNPFQYASSIMTDAAARSEHLKDTADLLRDLAAGSLPAVSLVKPDAMIDGHPASSKVDLFEAFVKNVIDRLDANARLERDSAVFVTFDEGGGYYDSGYIQTLDFFGDGPRIPLIVVSRFSRGGRVVHTYCDHVSILKFIERNWRLKPLTARSRDNLPNPIASAGNAYVPKNRPAIGDLFDMFDFKKRG